MTEGIRTPDQPLKAPKNTTLSETGGAESGARRAPDDTQDPDLRQVIDAWPALTEAVKAGIMEMVRSATSDAV